MPTAKELESVSDVLEAALAAGTEVDIDELSQMVWQAVEACRKRKYKYLIIGQDRPVITSETETVEVCNPEPGEIPRKALTATLTRQRSHCPTWAQGPFYTTGEASAEARKSRQERPDTKYMVVELFDISQEPKPKPEGIWM